MESNCTINLEVLGEVYGSGTPLPETESLLKGDGAGGAVAAVPDEDYATPELVDAKYTKPNTGIPKTDLASGVQSSLDKADNALQEHQSLAAYRTAAQQDVIDSGKQPTISDLETIRSGAAKGGTAVQPSDIADMATESYVDSAVSNEAAEREGDVANLQGQIDGKQDKAKTATVTIAVADWAGGTTCVKSVTGVTAASVVIVDTSDGGVECTAQGAGTLTFTAEATPTAAVTAKVVIL